MALIPDAERGLGYIPDVPAPEDLFYGAGGNEVPDNVDLRGGFRNKVEDQFRTNSCVANACVSALEYLIAQQHKDDPNFSYPELSRLFAYWEARKVHSLHTVDQGSSIRACVERLTQIGICEEALFPFAQHFVFTRPPEYCYAEAKNHRVLQYERLDGLGDMLDCLASGFPFVFGFQVYMGSMREGRMTGVMPMPKGRRGGGHAVCVVGYDKPSKMFIVRNSYGEAWGTNGYYLMPFDYVTDTKLSSDWWTLQALDWRTDAA
jgi:C1A family cysteine protease